MLHQYTCDNCNSLIEMEFIPNDINARGEVNLSGGYYCKFLVSSLSEEQIKELPEHLDPRDYELYETIKYKNIPSKIRCECNKFAYQIVTHDFNGFVKGDCHTNRKRTKDYYYKGLDKEQAHQFYQESIKLSKEAMATGHRAYKKVDPHLPSLLKEGKIRKTTDKERLERINTLHNANVELAKRAGINPNKRRIERK